MRYGTSQINMTHALAPDLGKSNFNATLLTDDAAMLQSLVLSAKALIVADRPENLGAEKAIAFRLESPVVDGFRFFDFTIRPRPNHLG
jgi:hypothetical protein